MRKFLLLLITILFSVCYLKAQVVTNLVANYRNGQTFLVWNNISSYDSGFYYIYRYSRAITSSNLDSSKYIGRIPNNSSFNYFLNIGVNGEGGANTFYFVINDNPIQTLTPEQGVFVTTCSDNKTRYYAVTADSGGMENRHIKSGANSLINGVAEQVAPVKAILQVSGLPLLDNPDLFYNAYVVFGGNIQTPFTPEMTNEGCLSFNFGIVKDADPSGPNGATFLFYGGGGNAYANCNSVDLPGNWKISMEDDIPNFSWDPIYGENTKWIGYHENFDVYNANNDTPWPTTGVDKTYTIQRVKWTYDWLLRTFPSDIDPHSIYTQGSSSGCTGAMLFGYLFPDKVAAVDVTNAKVDINYLHDDNPTCKWNVDGATRIKQNIFIGDYIANLPTDMPKINGDGYYHMYDMADFNVLLADDKNISLPIYFMTSGKLDNVTCWDEKIPFYNSVNIYKSGGFYYWDLRIHKGGTHEIQDRSLSDLTRYHTNLSYPAFQYCSADSYSGDTINPAPPYYDGDTVGTKFGTLDWVDSSIHETPVSWQAILYAHQIVLLDGSLLPVQLPNTIETDITLRRLQQFINIPDKAKICMDNYQNGVLIQSQSIIYHSSSGLITFKKVKVSQESNLVKVYICASGRSSELTGINEITNPAADIIYPNPTSGLSTINFFLPESKQVVLRIRDMAGRQLSYTNQGELLEGEHSIHFDVSSFNSGIYIVELRAGDRVSLVKVLKN
ncbi:MAG: T9SS type A sorting domain-containing protein [Chitinophagales bacterium]|nr:T9SS type A sorting domain-containing protein [Chitinophagales bacterium]